MLRNKKENAMEVKTTRLRNAGRIEKEQRRRVAKAKKYRAEIKKQHEHTRLKKRAVTVRCNNLFLKQNLKSSFELGIQVGLGLRVDVSLN